MVKSLEKIIVTLGLVFGLNSAPIQASAAPFDGSRPPNKYTCQLKTTLNVSDTTSVSFVPKCGGDNYFILSPIVYSNGELQGPKLGGVYSFNLSDYVGTTLRVAPFLLTGTDPKMRDFFLFEALYATLGFNDNKLLFDPRFEITMENLAENLGERKFKYATGMTLSHEIVRSASNALRIGVDGNYDFKLKERKLKGILWVDTEIGGNYAFIQTSFDKDSASIGLAVHF